MAREQVTEMNQESERREETSKVGMTENELVVIILIVTAVFLVIIGVYVWVNRKYFGFAEAK